MISHLENCLAAYMRNLPHDYRARPLHSQPDIVWGERVIPNFRETFQALCSGYIALAHGDANGLAASNGVRSDFKGQTDFWAEWMIQPDLNTYGDLLSKALEIAGNIADSEGAYWRPLDLTSAATETAAKNQNTNWPSYKVNQGIFVSSGSKTQRNGIYVPDVEHSCAQFLSTDYDVAPEAQTLVGMKDLLHPVTGEKYGEEPVYGQAPCTWFLIERETQLAQQVAAPTLPAATTIRVSGGQPCPQTGTYFTPARADSRQSFNAGEIMPEFDSTYGATIWQWDADQN